jgi:16S rRNA (adenine1518-N6/adenine1519-N6)-dimethyltransferase
LLVESEVRAVLRRHGLDARRSLGQNFVVDPATVERIARHAGVGPGSDVVEIGPGLGSLTLALHDTGARVLAVEKDRSLLPVLDEVLTQRGASSVEVVNADGLTVDWSELLGSRSRGEWALAANLPYNVAVPLVMGVLSSAPMVQRLVVMVQREVAERIVATPGGRVVGVPSIKVAWYAAAELLEVVPPEVFVPRPRIDSAVIRIVRRPAPSLAVRAPEVFQLVETAYRQRRKMLRSTLGGSVSAEQFERSGIAPTARPEELGVEEWATLAEAIRPSG